MTSTTANPKMANGHRYSLDGDSLSQDLHLKMSKKIAQLTKVIYVLNTRNDDHETVLEEIKNQHKSELRRTVSEVNGKIDELESRLKIQTGDQAKILELQSIIRSYETLLEQTKTEFLNYKEDTNRRNKEKDSEHVEQLCSLNDKISSLESSYKDLYDSCEEMQQQMDIEKAKSIKEVQTRYEKDILNLKEEFARKEKHLRELVSGSQKEIELELIKTQEEVKAISFSREKTIIQYEEQIKELKKSFQEQLSESLEENKRLLEFELEEAKAKLLEFQHLTLDKEDTLKSLIDKHSAELKDKDKLIEDWQKQTKAVTADNIAKMQTIAQNVTEIETLREMIRKKEIEVNSSTQEMDRLRKVEDVMNIEIQLKQKQVKDIKNNLDTTLHKLQNKDRELKDAFHIIDCMNQESKEMVHCTKSVSVDYEIQIQTLKRGLEELSSERAAEKQALERFHLNQEIEQAELLNRLKNEHIAEMEKLTKKSERDWLVKEKTYKEDIQKLKDENQMKFEEERSKASKMIEKVKLENEQIKNENLIKLKSREKQISVHEATIAERDKEIKGHLTENKNVKEKLSNIKKENHKLAASVTEKDVLIATLTNDLSELKSSLEEQMQENEKIQKTIKVKVQEDMSEKYNKLSADLDKKWADTLRRETGRLRNDMLDNFTKEKDKIIENIERIKNEEIAAVKRKFEEDVTKLDKEIEMYRDTLSKLEGQLNHEKEDINKHNMDKIQELEDQLLSTEKAHSLKMQTLEDAHKNQLDDIRKRYEGDRLQYISDMEALLETNARDWKKKHDAVIKSLHVENEKIMKQKMDECINEHNREMSEQMRELQMQMSESQQNSVEEYKNQIKDLYQKVLSLENQSKIQMDNHRQELEKTRTLKSASDHNYERLEQDLQEIVKENNYLKKQLEEFGDDYHRNQKEFTEKMRQTENDIKHHYEQIVHNNKVAYEEESKQTLQDFNKAQNLFKDKIKELNGKLLDIEERYQCRPSRDEDVELIETLRAQLRTSEKEIERMNEEKKFFQLELVNRETNFNKIFNASPNVGKVDSPHGAIKNKKASNEKIKNFQKLTPLPGSPFHDDPINPARPLPPSRKSIDAS